MIGVQFTKYSVEEGIDRNPFVKHLHRHGIDFVQYWINHEQAQKSHERILGQIQ